MYGRPPAAYRIADRRHPIFDGTGSFLHGARWTSPGRRVIYASVSYAGALLEMLVHTRTGRVPRTQAWIEIGIPEAVSVESVAPDEVPGWNEPGSPAARDRGNAWHESGQSLILLVPSVVTGGVSANVLIHQDHPEFPLLKISEPRDVLWDARLFPG